jgi:Homeodomain-like domain
VAVWAELVASWASDDGFGMPELAKSIEIGAEDRAELERIVRSSTAKVRMVERAQIVLHAAEGLSAAKIGHLPGCSTNTAQKWRTCDEQDGIVALGDVPRSGKPLIYSRAEKTRLIAKGARVCRRRRRVPSRNAGPMSSWGRRSGCQPSRLRRFSRAPDLILT